MANVTTLNLTGGVPTGPAGAATVSTIDNLPNIWDKGSGTGGSATQRIIIDSSQISPVGQQPKASSASVALASDQNTIPTSQDTSTLLNGTAALTPLEAKVAASTSGAATLVALVGGKKIRVLSCFLTFNGAVNVNFQSHTTTATATGLIYGAAAGDGIVLPFNPLGWFDTVSGEALDLNLSGSVAVGGHLKYVTV